MLYASYPADSTFIYLFLNATAVSQGQRFFFFLLRSENCPWGDVGKGDSSMRECFSYKVSHRIVCVSSLFSCCPGPDPSQV